MKRGSLAALLCVFVVLMLGQTTQPAELTSRDKFLVKMAHADFKHEFTLRDGKYSPHPAPVAAYFRAARESLVKSIKSYDRAYDSLSPDARERLSEMKGELQRSQRERGPVNWPMNLPSAPKLGDVGYLGAIRIIQIVDGGNLIVSRLGISEALWVAGVTTKGATDDWDTVSAMTDAFEVVGTRGYTTVSGSTKTVFELRPLNINAHFRALSEEEFIGLIRAAGYTSQEFAALYSRERNKDPKWYADAIVRDVKQRLDRLPKKGAPHA